MGAHRCGADDDRDVDARARGRRPLDALVAADVREQVLHRRFGRRVHEREAGELAQVDVQEAVRRARSTKVHSDVRFCGEGGRWRRRTCDHAVFVYRSRCHAVLSRNKSESVARVTGASVVCSSKSRRVGHQS